MATSMPEQRVPLLTAAATAHLPGAVIDEQGRPEPPAADDEWGTLVGFLEFQRATLHWKCSGLGSAGLQHRAARSTMTLGGLLKHLAWVEEYWFAKELCGEEMSALWSGVDWAAEPDWEWTSAAADSPRDLFTLWRDAVARSRDCAERAYRAGGAGQLAARAWPDGQRPSLRWILTHMVEEYARHNGHADLIRESIDGAIGE